MKIDFSQSLKDIDGNPLGLKKLCCIIDEKGELMKEGEGFLMKEVESPDEVVTLRKACVDGLLFNNKSLSDSQKADRFFLARDIQGSDSFLEINEVQKESINKSVGSYPIHGPLIIGQVRELLDKKDDNDIGSPE